MGQKTYQRILQCSECGDTPNDGEPLWEMGGDHWCEDCCNKDEDEEEERCDCYDIQGSCDCDVCGV